MNNLKELIEKNEAPAWMTEEGYNILKDSYLLPNETPRGMWTRVTNSSAAFLKKPELAPRFFDILWKNWLGLASPVAANAGTDRGLPISCFGTYVPDSIVGIMDNAAELAMMTKNAGGVSTNWIDVRSRGSKISGNGKSEGIIPFIKIQDSVTIGVSQGGVRRGASAAYTSIEHGDFWEFIKIRRPDGDVNRQCLNIHHALSIPDSFIEKLKNGDKEAQEKWIAVMKTRFETGEPYLFFSGNVERNRPECYKHNNLDVLSSNICCLGGETLVMTQEFGPKRIDELCGKKVTIWDGLNWVENNSFSQRGIDKLYRITLSDGTFIDANANHRWFAAKNYNDIQKNNYSETTTKNLTTNMWLESHEQEQHGNNNTNGAYIKGFILGDGTSVNDRPLLRLHSTKFCCENDLINSANELKVGKTQTNAVENISFSNEMIYDKTKAFGKQHLKNLRGLSIRKQELFPWSKEYKKKLPNEIFSWNRETKLKFLSGLFDADGTISNGCLQISSIHLTFINDLQLLFKTFGASSSVDSTLYNSRKPVYRLSISSFDSYKLIQDMSLKRIKTSTTKKPNRKTTGWRKIISIMELPGTHPVYCPILPTTGKFGLANGLMTGNTEITLHASKDYSFVCCLSSLNLARWDEWKATDTVQLAIWFLDGILEEFITKAKDIPWFSRAVASAVAGRAIGLGVMGFHSYLQEHMMPIDHYDTFSLNAKMFSRIRSEAERATKALAEEYGEPEWCKGFGRRNTHLLAVAPTVSNSTISGNISAGVEPWAANIFVQKSAKGSFIQINKELEKILEKNNKNNQEIWKSILTNEGSVQHLNFLSKEEKEVFLTARELNQFSLVKLAGQRQKWIDQSQSINLFFPANVDPNYVHEVHMAAYELGLNTLYYLRTSSVLKGDSGSREYKREITDCKACEG